MQFARHIASASLWVVLLLPTVANAQMQIEGSVIDASSGLGIPFATVIHSEDGQGIACDETGMFVIALPVGKHVLRISAVGFQSETVEVGQQNAKNVRVRLSPSILSFEEVVVSGKSRLVDDPAAPPLKTNTTEDLLGRVPGADFVQRANFAWEPVIRGMSGGQVGIVIDDIKVIGACVDKMDPVSSYVEVENLEKLELSKGGFDLSHSSQIGGTVNYVTEKPQFDNPYTVNADVGLESVSGLRRTAVVAGASYQNTSARASFTYKNAGNFAPGEGSDPIPNSGFEKNNLKIDLAQRFGGSHQLTASVLSDNAWNVGYPVLLMDATLAQARIYSLTHDWRPVSGGLISNWETRLYYNTVDHYMDDYNRDVMDRVVMRGMNMPMYGNTQTAGGISKVRLNRGRSKIGLTVDLYQTQSFGEMWMFSLFPDIPDMYLLNLGDILVQHGAISANVSTPIGDKIRTRIDARFDYSPRNVRDESARSILEGRWGTDDLARTYSFGNLSGTLEYSFNSTTRFRLALAHVGRLPTHVENYGHYIYNYVDGFFYSGNPDLKYERSSQIELGFEQWTSRIGIKASGYINHISNLIVGQSESGLVSGSETYRFKVYTNADAALMWGGELSGVLKLIDNWELAGSASYTWGQNLELDEPMYLIPPLTSLLALRYRKDGWYGEIETRMAMPQNRVSTVLSDEEPTDGYFILNLRGNTKIGEYLQLNAGIENVFDVLYHQHLSYGDLPSPGRNIYVGVSVGI